MRLSISCAGNGIDHNNNIRYVDALVDQACASLEELRAAVINSPSLARDQYSSRDLQAADLYYIIERLEEYREEGSCFQLSCINESGVYPPSTIFNALGSLQKAAELTLQKFWGTAVNGNADAEFYLVRIKDRMAQVHEAFSIHRYDHFLANLTVGCSELGLRCLSLLKLPCQAKRTMLN